MFKAFIDVVSGREQYLVGVICRSILVCERNRGVCTHPAACAAPCQLSACSASNIDFTVSHGYAVGEFFAQHRLYFAGPILLWHSVEYVLFDSNVGPVIGIIVNRGLNACAALCKYRVLIAQIRRSSAALIRCELPACFGVSGLNFAGGVAVHGAIFTRNIIHPPLKVKQLAKPLVTIEFIIQCVLLSFVSLIVRGLLRAQFSKHGSIQLTVKFAVSGELVLLFLAQRTEKVVMLTP